MTKPRFRINDLVYLFTSAKVGRLESYRVGSIHDNGLGRYIYQIFIDPKPPRETTVADRVDLKSSRDLFFTEDELVTACEAMDIALTSLNNQLSRLVNLRDSKCDTTATPSPPSPRTPGEVLEPRFSVDDIVFIKASARIGFIENYKVTNVLRTQQRKAWRYELNIRGDFRNRDQQGNLRLGFNKTVMPRLLFHEEELIEECEALDLAIAHLEKEITKMAANFVAVCD